MRLLVAAEIKRLSFGGRYSSSLSPSFACLRRFFDGAMVSTEPSREQVEVKIEMKREKREAI